MLKRLWTLCAADPESAAISLFFAAFVLGIALMSIPWALAIGGGTGLAVMVFWRSLTVFLTFWDKD